MQEKVCILGLQKRIKEVNLRSERQVCLSKVLRNNLFFIINKNVKNMTYSHEVEHMCVVKKDLIMVRLQFLKKENGLNQKKSKTFQV